MSELAVELPDGSRKTFQQGATFFEVAQSIGPGLAKASLAAKVGEQVFDLSRSLEKDSAVTFITLKSDEGLEIIRHSCAHVMAMAVQKLWPGTQVTIGPVIEDGFYYDFAFPNDVKISEKDFAAIEAEMKKIVKSKSPITREVWDRDQAIKQFSEIGEKFKAEIIQDLPSEEPITVYRMGDWYDLCRGPHIPSTDKVPAFKLLKIAGAYWRGDENNQMLTRIYATAWSSKQDLADYLHRLEEAKKRDHRILGKQLQLFSFHEEAPANPFFHAKGTQVYNSLVNYMRASNKRFGFQEVSTPLIMNVDLWHKSGHYDNYRENMYFTQIDETEAAVKPMNCPGHCLVYGTTRKSYRDLPLRMSEFGRVHRHERSGVTHGLFRVRTFVQDDAHVFCTPDQILDEVKTVLTQIDQTYLGLGFEDYKMELSTRPEKSIGSDEVWEKAESSLKEALETSGRQYQLNPGDGAFYGPKIDFHLIDSLKRSWQCGTVQLDFSMPERFGLEYQDSNDVAQHPVMIHRAVLGSVERFLGIFIEHNAGHFPLWAAPEQARLITVREALNGYAGEVLAKLNEAGIRATADLRNEKLGYKIREAQLEKVPYQIVIGDKEMEAGTLSPRHSSGNQVDPLSVEAFIDMVKKECGPNFGL